MSKFKKKKSVEATNPTGVFEEQQADYEDKKIKKEGDGLARRWTHLMR